MPCCQVVHMHAPAAPATSLHEPCPHALPASPAALWRPRPQRPLPPPTVYTYARLRLQEKTFNASRGAVAELSNKTRNNAVSAYAAAASAGQAVFPGGYAQWSSWLYNNWVAHLQLQENLFQTQDDSWAFWKARMAAWQNVTRSDKNSAFVADVAAAANKNLLPFFSTFWKVPVNVSVAAQVGALPAWGFDPAAALPV